MQSTCLHFHLGGNVAPNGSFVHPLDDGCMNMEHWWNENWQGRTEVFGKNLSQLHFFTIHYGLPWNWTLVTSRLGSAIWVERLHIQSSTLLNVPEPKLHALYSIYNTSGAFSFPCQIHIASGIISVESVYLLWNTDLGTEPTFPHSVRAQLSHLSAIIAWY